MTPQAVVSLAADVLYTCNLKTKIKWAGRMFAYFIRRILATIPGLAGSGGRGAVEAAHPPELARQVWLTRPSREAERIEQPSGCGNK
jgi:hypothetical protein